MNAKARTITISIPPDLQERLRSRTVFRGLSRSEYVRDLIMRDLDAETASDGTSGQVEVRLGFIEIGIDALLKHHPNTELRQVVHNTHRDRLQRRTGGEVEA